MKISDTMDKLKHARVGLMDELMPIAAKEPIQTDEGEIVYVDGSEGKTLSRDKVLAILIERLKISREAAETMLDTASDKKYISPYLKIIVKHNYKPKAPAVAPAPVKAPAAKGKA